MFQTPVNQCTSITEIKNLSIFSSLSLQDLADLAQIMTCAEYQAGEVIYREGEFGDRFYLIIHGRVEIFKSLGSADELRIRTMQIDDFFGEISLLDPSRKCTASVRALEAVRVVTLARQDFEDLLRQRPELAFHMLRELGLRLTAIENRTVRELSEKNHNLALAYAELQNAHTQLLEKERMEKELLLARQIQHKLLPESMPSLAGFDFDARMLPAKAVGGDMYDFIPLSKGRLGIVIGDVTDKGVPAALMMATTHGLIHAESTRTGSPEKCLRRVNQTLMEMKLDNMFATAVYGILQPDQRMFTYARAGHEVPLHLTASGQISNGHYAHGQPLGLVPDPHIDIQTIQLAPGDTVLMFTDGVKDALNAGGEQFGTEGLRMAVQSARFTSAHALCEYIQNELNRFQPVNQRYDDITLLAIHAH